MSDAPHEMQPPSPVVPPQPEPPPRRSRKTWLIIGIVAVVLLGVGSCAGMVARSLISANAAASPTAERFLADLRDGNQDAVWAETAPEFQQATPKDRMKSVLDMVDQQVGRPVSWKLTGLHTSTMVGTNGKSTVTTLTYQVTHQHGSTTATITVNGDRKLLGFHFNFRS